MNLGNVVEKRRDRKTIGRPKGVFWQTENMEVGMFFLKYREKAGDDTIQVTEVCF